VIASKEGLALVVECLPSKHEALSSNPSTAEKKKQKQEKNIEGKTT
jgi:hypothetical protein